MEEDKSLEEQIVEELREEDKRIKELEERVSKLEQVARFSNQRLVELQKDYELLKERYRKDLEEFRKYGYEKFALDILEVLDNLERALETRTEDINALRAGVEMIYRQLVAVLEKHGVRAMDLDGREFDPMLAEAVERELSLESPPNTVIRTIRKGYYLHERVLRPARVVVSYAEEEVT